MLHDLVNVIVLILLEPGVAELPEGSQLVRALNVLTVKIVDRWSLLFDAKDIWREVNLSEQS